MKRKGMFGVIVMLVLLTGTIQAADVILNEYNAVDDIEFLGGGDSAADENGGRAADSFFGRVPGNGGDWFELIVIKDHLDMRGWQLDTFVSGQLDKTLTLTAQPLWQDLRAGTIITVAQDVPSDVSYDPAAGDWWIHVQANDDADGKYISSESFAVNNKNWQLRIRNIAGGIAFGPAGEGVAPNAKVGGTEVFFLKEDPSASILANSPDYDTSKKFSTFGALNRWGTQDTDDLRPVITPKTGLITVLSPNGGEALTAGKVHAVRWQSTGVSEPVQVEFSPDGGFSWSAVYPPNVGNTGQYRWLVPLVDSNQALIRVSSTTRPGLFDVSDQVFTTIASTVAADLARDGALDVSDLALLAATWLN